MENERANPHQYVGYEQSNEEISKISPSEALENCILDKNNNSCNLAEKFNKRIGNETSYMWKVIRENLYADLIPLCSYATTNQILDNK